jgi:hypothetical protein
MLPKYGPESPQGGPNLRDQAEMEPPASGGNIFGSVKPQWAYSQGAANTRGQACRLCQWALVHFTWPASTYDLNLHVHEDKLNHFSLRG